VFRDIKPLLSLVDRSNKARLLPSLKTVLKNHPSRNIRMECIQILFDFYPDATPEETDIIVEALQESTATTERVEGEILPYCTQLMAETSGSKLCLLSKLVSAFRKLCSLQLRSTLLLSIIKQLSESKTTEVRVASAQDGAQLVLTFGRDPDAADKLKDLIELTRHYIFDSEATVQTAGLTTFLPSVVNFARCWDCVGKSVFEFWANIALQNGLTGSSQLAVRRFRLATQALEIIVASLLPTEPQDNQTLLPEPSISSPTVIIVPTAEFQWLKTPMPELLAQFSPLLYVPLSFKREATKVAARCCQAVGKVFTISDIAPAFKRLIESVLRNTECITSGCFSQASRRSIAICFCNPRAITSIIR
jgi:hypothetical protein